LSFEGTPYSLQETKSIATIRCVAPQNICFTKDLEKSIIGFLSEKSNDTKGAIMGELDLSIRVLLFIFGIGGCVALAIVPWTCIGTGLYDKDKSYQSY
jgi:hypothetical protein